DAVALEARRRVDQLYAVLFDTRLQLRQVVRIAAEREVVQCFGLLRLDHRAPAMIMAERLERERIAVALNVEAEIAVKLHRLRQVRRGQQERVGRMPAERFGLVGGRDVAANGGHRKFLVWVWTPVFSPAPEREQARPPASTSAAACLKMTPRVPSF